MTFDDFWPLMNEFNTVPSAIQTYGDFCDDFEGIARNAETADDFRNALDTHRKTQLRFYKTSLENISQEVGISHSHISSGLWNALLDLVSQNPLIKPVDELGWQSPVSLQGLIKALQHFHRRLVPTAPLAIKPSTPAPSPSAGSPPPSSDSSNQKTSQPTRTLRPRKQTQKKKCCYSWTGSEAGQFEGEESLTQEDPHTIICPVKKHWFKTAQSTPIILGAAGDEVD
jgi:hypothetical protein